MIRVVDFPYADAFKCLGFYPSVAHHILPLCSWDEVRIADQI